MGIRYHVIAIAAIAMFLGYLSYSNPSVGFHSSDGGWDDAEVVFKGRRFDNVIVVEFERYKLECSASKSLLIRTTKEEWANIFAWPSYLTNPKWRVPYAKSPAPLDEHHKPQCTRGEDDLKKAQSNADRYLSDLESR